MPSYQPPVHATTGKIFDYADKVRAERMVARAMRPLIRLWDGDWNLAYRVDASVIEGEFQWLLNDTGTARIRLPRDHPASVWAWNQRYQLNARHIHITSDKDGTRWGGRCKRISIHKEKGGERYVEMEFLHDYEDVRNVYVYPNPFLPAAVQFPRAFVMAGPVEWVLKAALWCNLYRMYGSIFTVPDNPLDIVEVARNKLLLKGWPIAIKPTPAISDLAQPWTVISSRMKKWHDVAESPLADAGMYVECRRWLEGDPPPWEGADLRHGTLVVDIVDKAKNMVESGGGFAGDLYSGFHLIRNRFEEGFLDIKSEVLGTGEDRSVREMRDKVPEYNLPGYLGTMSDVPYVVYRDGPISGVESLEFSHEPETATRFITGGHSMPGVNAGISAAIQAVGNSLGNFVFVPTAGTIADTILRPIYEDTLLAWVDMKSLVRANRNGWSRWEEHFVEGADRAYTLATIVAMRQGYHETRARSMHKIDIADGAPWFVGENGQGHFFIGDRIATTVEGMGSKLVVEQVTELTYKISRDEKGWEITVGDFRSGESGLETALRNIQQLAAAGHDLGVI